MNDLHNSWLSLTDVNMAIGSKGESPTDESDIPGRGCAAYVSISSQGEKSASASMFV